MTKNANGEGSVYRRKDGRYVAALTLPDGTRRYWYGHTREEAHQQLTEALGKLHRNLPLPANQLALGPFLTSWLENVVKPKVRPRTYDRYESILRVHLIPALGKTRLTKLTPQQVQGLVTKLLNDGLAPRTVAQIRTVLSYALNQALKWGAISRNVAALVDNPRAERPKIKAFNPEEARRFLEAVRGDHWEALYTVAVCLGLRQGEALGLSWQDVSLDAGLLHVRKALSKKDKTLVEPKSKSGRRTIALPPMIISSLRAHHARQLEQRLKAGDRWRDMGLVFTTGIGTPVDHRALSREFHALLEAAGLPRLRFHDLRHSCASLLLAQNVHPKVVMEILGHSQISVTLDTYSHVIPSLQEEAMSKMDRLLGGK